MSSDYSKSLHLQSDRSLEFHTPQGCHHTTRLPRYGRDLVYDRQSAEVLVPAVGVNEDSMGEVYRLNLELGRYMRSYEVDVGGDDYTSTGGGTFQGGINTGAVNTGAIAEESHNLLAFGTSIGTVELWDSRARGRAGILLPPTQSQPGEGKQEVTALEFHRSGLSLGTGSSNGLIHLYDLRSPMPLLKKDQGYGYPIHTIKFLLPSSRTREQTMEPKILSSDKRIIKIWDSRDGTPWTSVEPAVDINCVAWCKDSGMILTANEGRQQHAFFIPQLGPAPRWCSFLDNIVEEMAEDPNDPQAFASGQANSVYDNYKFLTVPQLRTFNLEHLIGRTNLLRPYMHGYFVAQRLYEEARLITNPYIWEEERAKRVKEKIDKERESRIRDKKKVAVKVNRKLAEKLIEKEESGQMLKAQQDLQRESDIDMLKNQSSSDRNDGNPADNLSRESSAEPQVGLLADTRFKRLFEDEDFAVDESSLEFRSLNPGSIPEPTRTKTRALTAVEQEELEDSPSSSSDDSMSDEETDQRIRSKKPSLRNGGKKVAIGKQPTLKMQVSSSTQVGHIRDRSFATRVTKIHTKDKRLKPGRVVGEKEITFTPRSKSKPGEGSHEHSKSASAGYRKKGRRSASGNTFRRV